ncbi:carboxymuconolactone decarboxylase family protein [Gordonia rubripertincta]|uniref:Carboxymuconolactone decarboxylase family protein n=1 Tax=Gordonia rubripertincta TaxID=36822 RepID=A0ABT4MV84_GORRU|nr:carboxymuconolactone decarboxylase family protein [Gordonia rubripertincta]MCZ4550186.1 carboxymuconolactone decarboxylase family protein [Gordonia rubripertincta]
MTARISPALRADWSPEMSAFVDGFRSAVASAGPEEGRQAGDNLLGTLARYPGLSMAFLTFNRHLLSESALSVRQRELLVLRVARIKRSDYEWAQHVILADRAGMTADEIAAVAEGPEASGWSTIDRALLQSVDDLLNDGAIGDATWAVLAGEFGEQKLMDVVFTVGCYSMLAMALRSFGVQPEEALVPFLPAQQPR